jgi:hypothetical protein
VFVDSATGEVELEQFDPDVVYEDTTLPDHVRETYRGRDGLPARSNAGASPTRS